MSIDTGVPRLTRPPIPVTPPPHVRRTYDVTARDGVFALVLLVVGYVWWDWLWPRSTAIVIQDSPTSGQVWYQDWLPGAGVPAFFVLALAVSVAYYRLAGVPLTRTAYAGAALLLVATGPFVLYSTTALHLLLGAAVLAGFIVWHASVCHEDGPGTFGLRLATHALNQGLAPFRNAGAWWAALTVGLRGHRRPAQAVATVIGLIVAAPVIVVVIALLASADTGFSHVVESLAGAFAHVSPGRVFWQAVFAVPVAAFAAGLLYANAHARGASTVSPAALRRVGRALQRVPVTALAAPLAILCLIYVVFFAAMGSSLFAGFAGHLPDGFTYASFARRGFFELAGVAAINAGVMAFVHTFAVRAGGLPRSLRAFGVALSGLTLLLIATSASKLLLYVSTYGLTMLRLVTLVFLACLFAVFALVLARHLRRFDVSRPLAGVVLVALLGLTWGNPQGLVARYDADRYLSGDLAQIDVPYLADNLGDAAIPALADLAAAAPSHPAAGQAAQAALAEYAKNAQAIDAAGGVPWMAWTWQRAQAVRIAEAAG
ncbi:MAG: DUF4173 domain-containing protein [Actinomycetia bacterium]|nr:DUF4173 domain-containing protein [Actinomycetes bacterium]